MGFSLSWVAVRGKTPAAVHSELGLAPTGAREDVAESPLVSAALPNGWTLVLANRTERFVDEALLRRLSTGCELVACSVEDHVMVSRASGWADGRQTWSVDHDGSDGPPGVEIEGSPPAALESIRQHLDESQKSSDGEVDFLYEAPVDLAKSVTGFRHDDDVPRGGTFDVLRETARRPFWRRLVGR